MLHEVKNRFIDNFKSKGFDHLPRVSMLSKAFPTNFTPSGGEERLADILSKDDPKESFCVIQPCFRYQDMDNISTGHHAPLFEMGIAVSVNEWSLRQVIKQFFMLFDSFSLDRDKLIISVFDGGEKLNEDFERDQHTVEVWKEFGIKNSQFEYKGVHENFFSLPDQGYAGIQTEASYEYRDKKLEIAVFLYLSHKVIKRNGDKYLSKFKENVICFGIGIERWAMLLEGEETIMSLNENSNFIDLYNDIKKDTLDISLEDFKRVVLLTKALLFLHADGANTDLDSKGRRNLLRKLLRKLKECYEPGSSIFKNRLIKPVLEINRENIGEEYPKVSKKTNIESTLDLIQNS